MLVCIRPCLMCSTKHDSVATTLCGVVSPSIASVRLAPATRGRKPVLPMMQEDHTSATKTNFKGGHQAVSVISESCSSTRGRGDILSVFGAQMFYTPASTGKCSTLSCDSAVRGLMTKNPSTARFSCSRKRWIPLHLLSVHCLARLWMVIL